MTYQQWQQGKLPLDLYSVAVKYVDGCGRPVEWMKNVHCCRQVPQPENVFVLDSLQVVVHSSSVLAFESLKQHSTNDDVADHQAARVTWSSRDVTLVVTGLRVTSHDQ